MKPDFLPEKRSVLARAVPLLAVALACAFACDDEATVQGEEMEPFEMEQLENQPEGERQPPREGPDGCYLPEQRSCDCAVAEADCTEDVGIWTTGCASCATP